MTLFIVLVSMSLTSMQEFDFDTFILNLCGVAVVS